MFVREKPKQGQANKEAKKNLAQYLQVPKGKVKLIKGFKRKSKILKIN
ncbi:hypothetical protein CL633_02740 [bacterium]|nr:hypothetical protein [bacterium]